jgi:hypothetical protein
LRGGLDAFGRALDFLRGFAALRDDEREDFDDVFFFAAPRAAEDFRLVFFARPELLDLAAFFFFFATGCSSCSGLAGARIIQFEPCRIEMATAF